MCKTIELRDYFAIHATDYDLREIRNERFEAAVRAKEDMDKFEALSCVEARYAFADAMMAARGINDGWIEWKGGNMPVPKGATVHVRHRDGTEHFDAAAGYDKAEDWRHDANPEDGDIVAYRVVKP